MSDESSATALVASAGMEVDDSATVVWELVDRRAGVATVEFFSWFACTTCVTAKLDGNWSFVGEVDGGCASGVGEPGICEVGD